MTGFEPATSWSQTKRSSQAALHLEVDLAGVEPASGNIN